MSSFFFFKEAFILAILKKEKKYFQNDFKYAVG